MTSKFPIVVAPCAVALPVAILHAGVANEVVSNGVVSNEIGPNEIGPNEIGPNKVGPNKVGPNEVVPKAATPNATDRSAALPNAAMPHAVAPDVSTEIPRPVQAEKVMPPVHLEIANLVISKIAAHCEQHMQRGVVVDVVVDTGTTFAQLQFDSLALLEIQYELEEELDITLDPATLPALACVGDLVAAVHRARMAVP